MANAEKTALTEEKKAEQEKLIAEMAAKDENKAYIALLMKTQSLDKSYNQEITKYFSFDEIQKLIQSYTTKKLEELSKNHSKYFEKYKIYR